MIKTLETIWIYIKRFFWILFVIAAAIFGAKYIRNNSKKKEQIDQRITELENIERKTEEDRKELERLNEERKKIEAEIEETNRKYKEKLNENESGQTGDAGESYNDLTKIW